MRCQRCNLEMKLLSGRGQWRKWCQDCAKIVEKAQIQEWLLAHPIRKKLYQKTYRNTHKQQRAEYNKRYKTLEKMVRYNENRRQARKIRKDWKENYLPKLYAYAETT